MGKGAGDGVGKGFIAGPDMRPPQHVQRHQIGKLRPFPEAAVKGIKEFKKGAGGGIDIFVVIAPDLGFDDRARNWATCSALSATPSGSSA